jgi:hypothetical protein
MADTKKEWANLSAWEKFIRIFVHCIGILIAAFVTYTSPTAYRLNAKGLDQGVNIWCLVHPGTVADIVGMILLWFGAFWLSGIWGLFVQDDDEDPWKAVTVFAWLCCIAGPSHYNPMVKPTRRS